MGEETRDIQGLRNRISSGETSARAAVDASVSAAEKLNDSLNAFLQIDRAGALKRVESLGNDGALSGIPIGIKDNICVRGLQASCGSRILGDYKPPYNATVIERLLGAGAVVIG